MSYIYIWYSNVSSFQMLRFVMWLRLFKNQTKNNPILESSKFWAFGTKIIIVDLIYGAVFKIYKRTNWKNVKTAIVMIFIGLHIFWYTFINEFWLQLDSADTAGIWITNQFRIQMVQTCPFIKWSDIQVVAWITT